MTDAELFDTVEKLFSGLEDSLRDQIALASILTAYGVQNIPKLMEDAKQNPELMATVDGILAPWRVRKLAMFQALKQRGGGGETPPDRHQLN